MLETSIDTLIISSIILFVAGIVKGGIGFGLPLVALPFLSLINSVELSLSILALPVMASSIRLAFAQGNFLYIVRRHRYMLISLFVGVPIGVYLITGMAAHYTYFILGSVLILFTLLGKVKLPAFSQQSPLAESVVGVGAGVIGGMSSAYGPLVAAYFSAMKIPKDEFVTTLNVMLMSGGGFMVVFFGVFGVYTHSSFLLSVAACLPVFFGLFVGEKLRALLNNTQFHNIVFIVLLGMGINLIRQAIF